MTTWQLLSHTLETLYYLSGIAVAIAAFLGLRQLGLAKATLQQTADLARTSSLRDAHKAAVEACSRYIRDIVPMMNRLSGQLLAGGVEDVFDRFIVHIDRFDVTMVPPLLAESEQKAFKANFVALCVFSSEATNALEGFATLFTSRVAAEQIAFSSVGPSFCANVQRLLPAIISAHADGHHRNLLNFYAIWDERLKLQKLNAEQESISKKMGQMQKVHIKPLGVDD